MKDGYSQLSISFGSDCVRIKSDSNDELRALGRTIFQAFPKRFPMEKEKVRDFQVSPSNLIDEFGRLFRAGHDFGWTEHTVRSESSVPDHSENSSWKWGSFAKETGNSLEFEGSFGNFVVRVGKFKLHTQREKSSTRELRYEIIFESKHGGALTRGPSYFAQNVLEKLSPDKKREGRRDKIGIKEDTTALKEKETLPFY